MSFFIASDHAGFELKEYLKSAFKELDLIDLGTNGKDSVDYPDFAHDMASNLKDGDFGILICGTGIGISMAANRHENIRCALCHDVTTARLAREHNDANVIALGARMLGLDLSVDIVRAFLDDSFLGGRHEKRVKKINFKKSENV